MPTIEIAPSTNIRELILALPLAQDVLAAFGLLCDGCSVAKYETLEAGASAHGLRIQPIVAALVQARLSRRMPTIMNEDRRPAKRRTAGDYGRRPAFAHVVPVLSGKGGVGKSLTTALLALGLRRMNKKVGILDADITGPSIPRFFGLTDPLVLESDPADPNPQARPLFIPAVSRAAIEIVSANLLTREEDSAMIWRGPIVAGVIRQFYEQAMWSDLDVLLVDLPPGTSDAPLTVVQSLNIDGVVLVTMPQALATMVVRKAANFVHQLKKPILGVIENMSYFVAPDTGTRYDIFGPSHVDKVAELARAPVLARLPIEPAMTALADAGRVEEIDDPLCDELARALMDALATHPKPQATISII
jgi:Mrp family chromosome partitioning ATPase